MSTEESERTAASRDYLVKIGNRIRTIRKQKHVSQEELAHVAGFSRSYFTEVETGKRNISVLNLIRVAKTLGVDPGELLRSLDTN